MSVHSYTESYRLADGSVFIDISDNVVNVTLSDSVDGITIDANASDLFHLAALFNRAYGRASAPELSRVKALIEAS